MAADDDGAGGGAKKPGFLRRLFGGVAPDAGPEAANTDAEAAAPAKEDGEPLEAASYRSEEGVAALLFGLDNTALDPLERVALAGVLPATMPADLESPQPQTGEAAPEGGEGKWWDRLRQGLSRSSTSIKQGIVDVFSKRKLDAATLEDLEDVLIKADLGVAIASRITAAVGSARYEKGIEAGEVQAILAREVESVLADVALPLKIDPALKPFVILVVGVNGSGKTTTIGKLAAKLIADGKRVTLGAGDTFRAAAIEQLRIWGERTGAPVVSRQQGSDAAGLAFDAVATARDNGSDVLLIDTAGRLQNRAELMDELGKVIRVIRKVDPTAPHAVLLVLDATVGQNAMSQVEIFSRVAGVTGIVMTKLDGTARGGILVSVAEKFGLPVHFIGVGEGVKDLEPFAAADFARAIAGLDH